MKNKLAAFLFISLFLALGGVVFAATNISSNSSERYAWNDLIGWIDFYGTDTVNVYSTQLTGYASSSAGFIALNCNSTPNGGNICGTSNFKVSNDGGGNLSGWAYNDNIGWISFASTTPIVYSVNIDSGGDFSGWAWNDNIGWISFNCSNPGAGGCGYPYKVKTAWFAQAATGALVSSVFDSGVSGGAALNSIMWKGGINGGMVLFQIASSNNKDGPWAYLGPNGTSLNSDVYSGDSGSPIAINPAFHNNYRYFRYKVILASNLAQTQSPLVEDIMLNWSR